MSVTSIFIYGPSDGALINCVRLWTLQSVDNASSLFKGTHKILLEVRHGKITAISNTNINSIVIKLSLDSLSDGVCYISHTSGVRKVTGVQKSHSSST